MAAKPTDKSRTARDLANRARRLAKTLSDPQDQDRLYHYADELEEQAHLLEREGTRKIARP